MGNSTSTSSNATAYDASSAARTPTSDLFLGCVIGQALGDGLGFLVEGEPEAQCTLFVKEELNVGTDFTTPDDLPAVKRAINKGVILGQNSYREGHTFNPELYATYLSKLFASGKVVGCGLGTAKAVAKLNRGISWEKSGTPSGSAGNGTAIRAAPIAMISFDNEENLIKWSKQQAFITHQDDRCQAGSIALAGAVAVCMTHNPIPPPSAFLLKLSSLCKPTSEPYAECLEKLIEWINFPTKKAAKLISKYGLDYDDGSSGISGFVVSSTLWALYSFLNNQNSYWDCICTAISAGGDTDSTAAMAGALSGAYLGLQQIPTNWASHVHDGTSYTYEDYITLAQSCYDTKLHGTT